MYSAHTFLRRAILQPRLESGACSPFNIESGHECSVFHIIFTLKNRRCCTINRGGRFIPLKLRLLIPNLVPAMVSSAARFRSVMATAAKSTGTVKWYA